MSVSVILKRNVSLFRIFLGSLLGGVTIFTLFVSISGLWLLLLKLFNLYVYFFIELVTSSFIVKLSLQANLIHLKIRSGSSFNLISASPTQFIILYLYHL